MGKRGAEWVWVVWVDTRIWSDRSGPLLSRSVNRAMGPMGLRGRMGQTVPVTVATWARRLVRKQDSVIGMYGTEMSTRLA